MTWLHTWSGVVLGGLLFAIFWTGTLSVFDREIDRWMMPQTRLALPADNVPYGALQSSLDEAIANGSSIWSLLFPSDRQPVFRVTWRSPSQRVVRFLDPVSGEALAEQGTLGGSGFFYPFHYMLHIKAYDVGMWAVGLAGVTALIGCLSGVVVHRRIFADFFRLRMSVKSARSMLDVHNVAGVLGLPFHVAIALSGIVLFYTVYFPFNGRAAGYPDRESFLAEVGDRFTRPKAHIPGGVAPLESLVQQASGQWEGRPVRAISVHHPGDVGGYVQITRAHEDTITFPGQLAFFDAGTADLLHRSELLPVAAVQRFLSGFHLIQFRHWTLRWLYFALGLLGCVMIATGLLFWSQARQRKLTHLGSRGVRIVESLTVGSVIGILMATLAFFVVNRLLSLCATFPFQESAVLEIWTFYLVWLTSFAHAGLRPSRAWIEQCWVIAALAVSAVILNWITTGDHLARSAMHHHLWPIAGMDVILLVAGATSAWCALRLRVGPTI